LKLPEKVRRKAAAMGETGRAWLDGLPQQIAELERRWAIKVGQPVRSGSEAFVAEARTSDGLDVVLKIVIPGIDPTRQELRILRTAQGIGYAKLIRGDEIANSMLLEKLGPQLHEFHFPENRKTQIICATLRTAWIRPPQGLPLATGAAKAVELSCIIESQWSSLGEPCSGRTIELALSYAGRRRRACDPDARMGGYDSRGQSSAAWPPSLQPVIRIHRKRASADLGVGLTPMRVEWFVAAADWARWPGSGTTCHGRRLGRWR
jgi:streptomycin 6-kinase